MEYGHKKIMIETTYLYLIIQKKLNGHTNTSSSGHTHNMVSSGHTNNTFSSGHTHNMVSSGHTNNTFSSGHTHNMVSSGHTNNTFSSGHTSAHCQLVICIFK